MELVKIKDIVKEQRIVILHTKDTVETALEKLQKNGITSAPVIDDNNHIWGFLDVVDLLGNHRISTEPEFIF